MEKRVKTYEVRGELDAALGAIYNLPPAERAVAAKAAIKWMQENMGPVGKIRRTAVLELFEDDGLSRSTIGTEIGERLPVVDRLLAEAREARRRDT